MLAMTEDMIGAESMATVTLEQSHQELYNACKAILVMIDWFESVQFEAEYARIDSPRLLLIRQALINAEKILQERCDEK